MKLRRKKKPNKEKDAERYNFYLKKILHEMLEDGSEKSGQSMSEMIAWFVYHGWEDWKEEFLPKLKKKGEEDVMDMKKAYSLGKKEYSMWCQKTSDDRLMRSMLFDYKEETVSGIGLFEDWLNYDPDSLWEKLKGRFSNRPYGWVSMG